MKLSTLAFAALLLAGCYNPTFKNGLACDTDGACPGGQTCGADGVCRGPGSVGDAPPDAPVVVAQCTANTTVCDGRGHIVACDGNGKVSSDVACPLGCAAAGAACAQMQVSNDLTRFLDDASTGADMVFPNGTSIIDESTGAVTINNASVSVASEVINNMRVFAFHSLKISGQLQFAANFSDTPAVVFVVDGDVQITGSIDVSGHANTPGPGSLTTDSATAAGCIGGEGGHDNLLASRKGGGGGAGGYHVGAAGGQGAGPTATNVPFAGGTAGPAPFAQATTLVPLRGGCLGGAGGDGGGSFAAGGGGGAIQISSTTSITLSGFGVINASGGGGAGLPQQDGSCGYGGGSGGAILLEAPAITLDGANVVLSTKGGGGGGTGVNVNGTDIAIAQDGGTADAPALGGFQASPGTFLRGGNGGTVNVAPTVGPGSTSDVGAGGGGGVGQARFNTKDGTVMITNGAVVRSPVTTGKIQLQGP